MGKTALLLGASGLAGGHCLSYLLNDDYYSQVDVIARRPLDFHHPKLVQHLVKFDRLAEECRDIKVDDVFCCLGTTMKKAGSREAFYKVDFTYPLEVAKLSKINGAKQFLLVSALGANPKSSIFYNRVKGEVEEAIGQCGYQGFHVFRPSLLLGERQEKRMLEGMAQVAFNLLSRIMIGAFGRYRAIEGKTVAYSMVWVAKKQQGGRVIESREIQRIFDQSIQ